MGEHRAMLRGDGGGCGCPSGGTAGTSTTLEPAGECPRALLGVINDRRQGSEKLDTGAFPVPSHPFPEPGGITY